MGADAPHLGQISAINDPLICSSKGVKSWIFKFYKSFTSTTNEAPKKQHPSALGHDLDIKLKYTCNVHQGKVHALSWGAANTFISASQDGSLCVQVSTMSIVNCTYLFSEVGRYKSSNT